MRQDHEDSARAMERSNLLWIFSGECQRIYAVPRKLAHQVMAEAQHRPEFPSLMADHYRSVTKIEDIRGLGIGFERDFQCRNLPRLELYR